MQLCNALRTLLIHSSIRSFIASRRRHRRYPLVTGVQPCALPIYRGVHLDVEVDATMKPGSIQESITVTEIGRASCRERVEISAVAVSLKKKHINIIAERVLGLSDHTNRHRPERSNHT